MVIPLGADLFSLQGLRNLGRTLRSWRGLWQKRRDNWAQLAVRTHLSRPDFAEGLKRVWNNCATAAKPGCRLVIRFGTINDRKLDARELLKISLVGTPWKILTSHNAGTASHGRRQADAFVPAAEAMQEYDVWAIN